MTVLDPRAPVGDRLDILRGILLGATGLPTPMAWFHETLACDPDLFACSDPMNDGPEHDGLCFAVAGAAGLPERARDVMILHVPGHGFSHGLLLAPPCMAIFFHFADCDVGLVTVERLGTDAPARLVRFAGRVPRWGRVAAWRRRASA
jgi:hypothetical protein